jgi:hypothetical protein
MPDMMVYVVSREKVVHVGALAETGNVDAPVCPEGAGRDAHALKKSALTTRARGGIIAPSQ